MDAPPLHELTPGPVWVRRAALAGAHFLMGVLRASVLLAGVLGRFCSAPPHPGRSRVVLTGMFVSDAWVEAHVRPLALSERCGHVWVVTDRPMGPLPKTEYVCAPLWLQRVIGKVPSRSVYCVLTALRVRPHVIGGFHLLLNGVVALIAARLVRARSMYFCVGGWTEIWGGGARSENRLFHLIGQDNANLERQILDFVQQIDLTLTMGTRARRFLQEKGITRTIEVMAGGIDDSRFIRVNGSVPKAYDIVFVGRLVPIKRVDILLRIVAEVARRCPGVRVALVGDGPLRTELERQACELGIERNVAFLGRSSDVAGWLQRSRVFVLTSDSEGLALSLMEAMMAGLPAVVSNVGDLGDLVEEGVNGWAPPRRDVGAFADRLVTLLTDEGTYHSFSLSARRAAMMYSLDSTRRRWDELLGQWQKQE